MAKQFVNSPLGKKLQEQWEAAQSQKDIQECLKVMIPELLEELHGQEHYTSRPTYYDASGGAPSQ